VGGCFAAAALAHRRVGTAINSRGRDYGTGSYLALGAEGGNLPIRNSDGTLDQFEAHMNPVSENAHERGIESEATARHAYLCPAR